MPSNGCLMTLIKGVNVLMEPFEDRPNLYEDQFSQFIRKEPADGEEGVCVSGRAQDFKTQHYTCDLAAPTVCLR